MNQYLIFLPGIMGSELFRGADLIWPGPAKSLWFPYKLMDQLLDPALQVGDIIRSFSVSEQYGALMAKLGQAGFSEQNRRLAVCPYDWRKRNEDAAETLAQMIEKTAAERGPDVEITLIAHSMGGLISRYYLESGLFHQRAGFARVKNLFTLGTPHRGSPLALTAAAGLEKRLFLSRQQVQQLVQLPDFPSLYQLLPPPGDDFAWDDRDGKDLYRPFPVYDRGAADLALTAENLQSARDFRARLTGIAPAGVRYFCFTGTRMPTLTHVRITAGIDALQVIRMEAEDAGDGTVPSWSGGLPGVQGQFVGGEHGTIYKSRELLTTLGGLLGVKNTLAADIPPVQIAIRDKVMEPGVPAHLSISFPTSINGLTGEVAVERVFEAPDGKIARTAVIQTYPVKYEGMGAEKLNLMFKAPQDPGFFHILFRAPGIDAQDDFFIQDE
jgi:pimeloyl-ACP methyl ester carboxylesterase